jgi:hypothetical protein
MQRSELRICRVRRLREQNDGIGVVEAQYFMSAATLGFTATESTVGCRRGSSNYW